VSSLANGGFVVTWSSFGQDGSGLGIYGQLYDGSGLAVGGEFQINSYTDDNQNSPQIASLGDGGFVVVWNSFGQDGSNYGVYSQRFNADGTLYGIKFNIGNLTEDASTNIVTGSLVASDVDRGTTLTWTLNNQPEDTVIDGLYGHITLAATGEWTYTLDNSLEATQALTTGQTVTDTFTATITDEHSATATQTITITVSGVDEGSVNSRLAIVSPTEGDDNPLVGDAGNNEINGLGGNDVIMGGDGDDTLVGGHGDDLLQGAQGADTYVYRYGDDGRDIIIDDASDGTIDTLKIFNTPTPSNDSIIVFELVDSSPQDLFVQVGNTPDQGILIAGFFDVGNGGTRTVDAAVANDLLIVYSDDGVTELSRLTGQQIFDQNHFV
jgi:VCBS repeat-containing protein